MSDESEVPMELSVAKQYMLDYANDMVIITKASPIEAPHGPEIIWVNNTFTHITKYSKKEVIGKTPRLLQGSDTSKKRLK